jgi:hypothetical protein
MTIIATAALLAGGAEISCAASLVPAWLAARTACTAKAIILALFSVESMSVVAASPWFWEGCLAGIDVIAISSQTLQQAEFERVTRVSVSKAEMKKPKKQFSCLKLS